MPTARTNRPTRTKSPTRNSDQVNCLRCAIRNFLRAPETEERTPSEGGPYKNYQPKPEQTQEHRLKSVLLKFVLPLHVPGRPTRWDNYTRFKSKNVADTDPWTRGSHQDCPQSKR